MSILICEDNKLAQKALSAVLERQGYEVFTAADGIEATEFIKQREYDLIIIDIHLPFHSGLELVRYLRHNLVKNTPVIVVSAFSDPQVQKQAMDLGVNEYFTKPINAEDLINRVKLYIKDERS